MPGAAQSLYHSVLRVSAVVCALVLLFESGLVHESTRTLAAQTHSYLATAIGMSASVEPNELNVITAELSKQQLALEAREQEIREREIEIGLAPGQSQNQQVIYILSGILFILLVLIVLNYSLDYIRYQEQKNRQRSQTV